MSPDVAATGHATPGARRSRSTSILPTRSGSRGASLVRIDLDLQGSVARVLSRPHLNRQTRLERARA